MVSVPNAIQNPEAFFLVHEVTLSCSLIVPKDVKGQDDTGIRTGPRVTPGFCPTLPPPAMWIWRGHLNSIGL